MASARYTLNITPEPPREKHVMTKKEKWKNWWDYHLWHVIIGVIAAAAFIYFLVEIFSQVKPDYQIGIMTQSTVPTSVTDGIKGAFTLLADDRNGDGRIVVQVNVYEIPLDTEASSVDAEVLMANTTRLMADGQTGESAIFITDEPQGYALNYSLFAKNDGTTPTEESQLESDFGYKWSDCPVLAGYDLGTVTELANGETVQQYLENFYILKRTYTGTSFETNEKNKAYYDSAMQIFDAATAQ